MKHSVTYLFVLMLVLACKPTVPSEYIQPDEMEEILYDYHIAQAMSRTSVGSEADLNKQVYLDAVLKKYGISSLVYYYSRADRFKEIYSHVSERLNDEAKALGAGVGELNRYSQYSTTGDTANIWTNTSEVLLIPRPTQNRFDFTVKVDTTFHLGDSFMFQFMSEFLYQTGSKDAVVCVLTKYEGDSIIQTANHVSIAGLSQIRVPANREQKLKEMYGFIYLSGGNNDETTRKLMFISQMQLIRFHNKDLKNETSKDSLQTDSLQRGDDPRKPMPVPTGDRIEGRSSNQPVPIGNGDSQHRVDAGPVSIKERR